MDTKKQTTLKEKFTRFTDKQSLLQMLKFLFFSIGAGIIQILSFTLMNELLAIPYWPAYLVSLLLSIIFNFTFNRHFTFKSSNNIPVAMTKVIIYYCVFTPLSTLWGDALTNIGWNEYIVLGGTMIINFVTEFLYQRFFVFAPKYNKTLPENITLVRDENCAKNLSIHISSKFSLLKSNQDFLNPNKNESLKSIKFH